ncbi:helix-turn-helix domain-containing protein [Gaoshiqia sp. Z1-71]|uniref:helix-turn-helix domain-containing protein n=1 Tax=Gaoshiqia hydrogeniformans TaxID=3290090 RepID=UPI003BF8FDC3
MSTHEENDHFTVLENKSIGRNLALFRKLRDKKALEVAEHIGLSEAAYTKYERGESKITIEMIQKVAEFLKVDPLQIVSTSPNNFLENIQNSSIAIQDNSTFQTYNEQQMQSMLKLMDNMMSISSKLIELLDKNK